MTSHMKKLIKQVSPLLSFAPHTQALSKHTPAKNVLPPFPPSLPAHCRCV